MFRSVDLWRLAVLPAALLLSLAAPAQTPGVGIGTTTPDASAVLDYLFSSNNPMTLYYGRLDKKSADAVLEAAAWSILCLSRGLDIGYSKYLSA